MKVGLRSGSQQGPGPGAPVSVLTLHPQIKGSNVVTNLSGPSSALLATIGSLFVRNLDSECGEATVRRFWIDPGAG